MKTKEGPRKWFMWINCLHFVIHLAFLLFIFFSWTWQQVGYSTNHPSAEHKLIVSDIALLPILHVIPNLPWQGQVKYDICWPTQERCWNLRTMCALGSIRGTSSCFQVGSITLGQQVNLAKNMILVHLLFYLKIKNHMHEESKLQLYLPYAPPTFFRSQLVYLIHLVRASQGPDS